MRQPSTAEPPQAAASPEVSVVIIFKDAGDFLSEAIESVRAQTFRGWELVLVDDGSTDTSTAIARHYAERDGGRISYLEHPGHANRGMSATRNLGVSHARGELVAFLDADDALVPAALDEQVAVLRAHPRVGMVYGPLEYWYGWTGKREDEALDFIHAVGVLTERVYEPPSLIAGFIQNIAYSPAGMLLRRSLFARVGGFEESFRDLYEDQVFAAKICRSTPVYVSGRRWYRYRQHPNSCCLSAQREGRLEASRVPFLRWVITYLEKEGLAGSDAWQVARLEIRRQSASRRLVARASRAPQLIWQLAMQAAGGGGTRR
jgi:glycosyltransferase involved in cell wall biosynthesis